MSQAISSLWFPEIQGPAETPLAILRAQAEELAKLTGGLLVGVIDAWPDEGDKLKIALEITAPDLGPSRFRILSVQHDLVMPYPAVVDAEVFRPRGIAALIQVTADWSGDAKKPDNRADDDPEFRDLLKKVLHSSPVKALVSSLMARVTELRSTRAAKATA